MARRRFDEEPDHHERWLVSYADLMTLLFAFFVVMYAISSVNEGKYKVLSNALGSAFGGRVIAVPSPKTDDAGLGLLKPLAPPRQRAAEAALRREKEQMTGMARDIRAVLAPLVSQGKVKVTQSARGLSVEISDSVLFAAAKADLDGEAQASLRAVAEVLAKDTHAIQVEGHTDNVPIKTANYPSNWELSAVRAGSVIRLFVEAGVAESRVTAVGRGATRPVASNETVEGRGRNRRVEVLILAEVPEVATELGIP